MVLAVELICADRVDADIGGDLRIESLQDRATYKERSQQSSASATVGAGGGGSFSASRTNIESEYASVGEQSGIRSGDGGFDVHVKGKTVLKGGAITSTQVAVDEQRNDFESEGGVELEDVRNEARYKASGWSAGAGVYVSDKKNGDGSAAQGPDGQPLQDVHNEARYKARSSSTTGRSHGRRRDGAGADLRSREGQRRGPGPGRHQRGIVRPLLGDLHGISVIKM